MGKSLKSKFGGKSGAKVAQKQAVANKAPVQVQKAIVKPKSVSGKPPKKPKRPLSAYMLYSNKVRSGIMDELRARYGYLDLGTIAREISERWADLEDKDRKKYERMAAKRKETYRGLMETYQEATDPIGALRKKYEHLIPKRPASAYSLFCADEKQRKKVKDSDGDQGMWAKFAELWKAASAKEKASYEEQSKKEKA